MVVIKRKSELKKYLVGNRYMFGDNVVIEMESFETSMNIDCSRDIKCRNIECGNIECGSIECKNIKCRNIECGNIECKDIVCRNMECKNLNCKDILCRNINCETIKSGNIYYYSYVIAEKSFRCKSIRGRRENSIYKCLDGKVKIGEGRKSRYDVMNEGKKW